MTDPGFLERAVLMYKGDCISFYLNIHENEIIWSH